METYVHQLKVFSLQREVMMQQQTLQHLRALQNNPMPAVPNTPHPVLEQTLTKPKSVDPHVLHRICHFCDLDPNIEGIIEYIPAIL
jgi:hypothetical protein